MKKTVASLVFALVILCLIALYLQTNPPKKTSTTTQSSPTSAIFAALPGRSKTAACAINGALPDPGCTPGAVFPDITSAQICVSGYSSTVRNVPESEKSAVYAEYGIASHSAGEYEVDHFISLELGGTNDIANLWPEPANPTPGFHQKDAVENYLHAQVCSGAVSLQQAQQKIASNWLVVYQNANLGH